MTVIVTSAEGIKGR